MTEMHKPGPRDPERGAALVLAMMILLVLAGLGLVAIKFVHTEVAANANLRSSRTAWQVAEAGLKQTAALTTQQPLYFHEQAFRNNPAAPSFTFPTGLLPSTADAARLGTLQYSATMSRPRLAGSPAQYQVGGSFANRFVFYTYQIDVTGTVNGDPVNKIASPGGNSALKQLRGDVRIGPIPVQQ
jgi:Tfp pilus assembly protein PilX